MKYDFANTAYEVYGLYTFNSDESYIKVGAFEPSYGIRLDDHTAYTRGGNLGFLQGIPQVGLFFVPDYRDLGVEAGSRFGSLFVTVDATNGDGLSNIDFNSKKAFIGKAEYLMKGNFMVGASGYTAGSTNMYGLQAGAGLGEQLTILGEWDWANSLPDVLANYPMAPNARSNAAFVEITYFIINGLSATGRFDYFKTFSGDGSTIYSRYILGVNIYPVPHVDLMPQVRFNSSNASVGSNPIEALVQSHIYF